MKENNQRHSVKILKDGVLFYKPNSNFFRARASEYFLDFKNNLNTKQFKIGR